MELKNLVICVSSLLFTACGGGGGSSGTGKTDPEVVKPPEITNTVPVSVIETSAEKVLLTELLDLSGLKSSDKDGDTLSYQWSVVSKPASSQIETSLSNSDQFSFVPDVVGKYVLSLTVSDGKATNTTEKIVQVEDNPNIIALSFRPSLASYSSHLDKIIAVDDQNNVLNIIDRQNSEVQKVVLSDTAQVLKLSPNGKFAIVIHPNHISYIDITTAQLLKAYPNEGPYTDGFITDNSIAYFIGKENGQWNDKPLVKIDLKSGQQDTQLKNNYYNFYSTLKGVYSEKNNQIFFTNFGSSPRDIFQITIDPLSGDAISSTDSPYHGDYSIGDRLFLNEQQDYIYTGIGTYFYAKNLNYGGKIKLDENQNIQSFVQDPVTNNLNILTVEQDMWSNNRVKKLNAAYAQYSGYGYGVVNKKAFPVISGLQSYGLNLFKDNTGKLFSIVQIGSAEPYTANLKYFVVK